MSGLSLRELRDRFGTPTWPSSIDKPAVSGKLGIDYDSSWSRTPLARAVRTGITEGLTRPITSFITSLEVHGADQLAEVEGPVMFVANHSSHLDTAIIFSALPSRFRRHTIVAAAADYFFDRAWKANLWALLLGTIPIERQRINRRSADVAAKLVGEGWSLLIFPEGGRTHDGWGQEFHGYAAYLAKRAGMPVVPIHLRGARPVFPRGSSRLRPGKVEVRFGAPLVPQQGGSGAASGAREEDARRFSARIEAAVALLADEAETDWWSARQRAARGETPPLSGRQIATWRRAWELPESARQHPTKVKKNSSKPW